MAVPAAHRRVVQSDAGGPDLDVLIDTPRQPGHKDLPRRTYTDAPDVDGVTLVPGTDFQPGDMVFMPDRRRPGLRPGRPPALCLCLCLCLCLAATSAAPSTAAEEAGGLLDHPGRDAMNRSHDRGSSAAAGTATEIAQPRFWNVPNTMTVARLVLAVVVFAFMGLDLYAIALAGVLSSPHCPMRSTATSLGCSSNSTPIGRLLTPWLTRSLSRAATSTWRR